MPFCFPKYTSALTALWWRFAYQHIALRGPMMVFPSGVEEYSTTMIIAFQTRHANNP
jgi:hypothetical protein